jgi:hypothetical protein
VGRVWPLNVTNLTLNLTNRHIISVTLPTKLFISSFSCSWHTSYFHSLAFSVPTVVSTNIRNPITVKIKPKWHVYRFIHFNIILIAYWSSYTRPFTYGHTPRLTDIILDNMTFSLSHLLNLTTAFHTSQCLRYGNGTVKWNTMFWFLSQVMASLSGGSDVLWRHQ